MPKSIWKQNPTYDDMLCEAYKQVDEEIGPDATPSVGEIMDTPLGKRLAKEKVTATQVRTRLGTKQFQAKLRGEPPPMEDSKEEDEEILTPVRPEPTLRVKFAAPPPPPHEPIIIDTGWLERDAAKKLTQANTFANTGGRHPFAHWETVEKDGQVLRHCVLFPRIGDTKVVMDVFSNPPQLLVKYEFPFTGEMLTKVDSSYQYPPGTIFSKPSCCYSIPLLRGLDHHSMKWGHAFEKPPTDVVAFAPEERNPFIAPALVDFDQENKAPAIQFQQ